jgi:hypothetical protein
MLGLEYRVFCTGRLRESLPEYTVFRKGYLRELLPDNLDQWEYRPSSTGIATFLWVFGKYNHEITLAKTLYRPPNFIDAGIPAWRPNNFTGRWLVFFSLCSVGTLGNIGATVNTPLRVVSVVSDKYSHW